MSTADDDWNVGKLDSPESAPDVLGREVFASTIARGLSRNRPNESLITAVYGPWGSGKSWLKHRILKDLAGREKELTIVEFSPWQIRGVDELTLQFFAQVHEKLSAGNLEQKPSRPKKREKMWMALARLSGAGASALKVIGGAAALDPSNQVFAPALMAAAGVSEQFAKLLQSAGEDLHEKNSASPANAEDARRELAKLFTETGTPSLLVVMDDFDRLTSEEIQTLVRLIKANANFPGLNYLIICDPDQLAAALDPISSNKGREFLEKIVQNPVRLPPPDADAILRQLASGLEKMAENTGYALENHLERLRSYFQNFLRLRLKNLRSVYRLLEVLGFSVAALTREGILEVDLLDLLAVDFLRLHVPALADWLQEVRPSFYVFTAMRDLFDRDKKQPLKEVLPQSIVESFGGENSYAVLRTLFPQVAQQFPADEAVFQRSLGSLERNSPPHPLAIADEEHFEAYFRLQPNASAIPESVYRAALLVDGGRTRIAQDFAYWISEGWMVSGLRRLKVDCKELTAKQRHDIFLGLADCSDLMKHADTSSFEGELRSAIFLMEDLLEGTASADRERLLDECFSSVTAITARLVLLEELRIRSDPEAWKDRTPCDGLPVFAKARLVELRSSLAAAASVEIRERSYFDHTGQGFRIYRWANAVGTENTEAFLKESLKRGDRATVLMLLRGITRAMMASYNMSFEDPESYANSSSKGLLKTLPRFASARFWQEFATISEEDYPSKETPTAGDGCIIQHVRRAFLPLGGDSTI